MYVPRDKSRDRMAMVLPVLGLVAGWDGRELRRPDKHVGIEYDQPHGDQAHHGVVVEHILELDILPSAMRGYDYKKGNSS